MHSPLPEHAVVWFEIPVRDMDRSRAFYAAILQNDLKLEEDDPNPLAVFAARDDRSVTGHVYPGKPAARGTGPTIHLAAPLPLESALERVGENGGQVVSPVTEIPAGRFAYCLDPDGNSFGLFAR